MTSNEAAAKLNKSLRRIQQLLKTGKLKGEKRGRDWWITEEELEKLRLGKPGRPKKGA